MNGWICLDKPEGISSNSAMIKVRRIFECKTGYIGTLDPFATGALPIAIGEARKFIPYTNELEKTYIFTMIFGTTTDSLDKDGDIIKTTSKIPEKNEVAEVLTLFIGEQYQMPPAFSAIKINGKRACDRVRNGENIQLSPRKITIFSLSIIHQQNNEKKSLTLQISCSKGTYVRSIARDIAEKLGTVAYVESLRRIKSGFFSINNAISLEKLHEMKDTNKLVHTLISLESPLDDIPALYLRQENVAKLQNGLKVSIDHCDLSSTNVLIHDDTNRKFKGIGIVSDDGSEIKAVRMCIY